jgi:hypothetical protein
MKKYFNTAAILLLVLLMGTGYGIAGNGKGGDNGKGSAGGTRIGGGIAQHILDGTPFEFTGAVVSIATGMGMEIATADGNVTVYGIGPVRYWESVGAERPAVGDEVAVSGYSVDFNGELRNIAMAITVDGTAVQLRDPDTALPLWRGNKAGKK